MAQKFLYMQKTKKRNSLLSRLLDELMVFSFQLKKFQNFQIKAAGSCFIALCAFIFEFTIALFQLFCPTLNEGFSKWAERCPLKNEVSWEIGEFIFFGFWFLVISLQLTTVIICAVLAATPGCCYCQAVSNKIEPQKPKHSESDSSDTESNSRNKALIYLPSICRYFYR